MRFMPSWTTRALWWTARALLWTAGVVLPLGMIFIGAAEVRSLHRDIFDFDHAAHCVPQTSSGRDCIQTVDVRIVDRSTWVTDDSPPAPPLTPPAPPMPPPIPPGPLRVAQLALSTTTHYEVTVRTPTGKRHTLEVSQKFYKAARPGRTARAEIWRDRVSKLTIDGLNAETKGAWGKRLVVGWAFAWAGVLLLIGMLTWPFGVPPGVDLLVAWSVGTIAYALLHNWAPSLYVISPIACVAIILLRRMLVYDERRPYRW